MTGVVDGCLVVSRYEIKTYGTGIAVKVTPKDRSEDVLYYLITGQLMGGRSLDGVTWEEVDNSEYNKLALKRAKALVKSMERLDERK